MSSKELNHRPVHVVGRYLGINITCMFPIYIKLQYTEPFGPRGARCDKCLP